MPTRPEPQTKTEREEAFHLQEQARSHACCLCAVALSTSGITGSSEFLELQLERRRAFTTSAMLVPMAGWHPDPGSQALQTERGYLADNVQSAIDRCRIHSYGAMTFFIDARCIERGVKRLENATRLFMNPAITLAFPCESARSPASATGRGCIVRRLSIGEM